MPKFVGKNSRKLDEEQKKNKSQVIFEETMWLGYEIPHHERKPNEAKLKRYAIKTIKVI